MRIVGGWAGGRRLIAPPGSVVRPTSDRVREAIFNILGRPPEGAAVLDLFAGSGALGLEALSRGAATATFVDRSAAALRCLRDNVHTLGAAGTSEIHRDDALRFLRRRARETGSTGPFHWVFIDPPYATELAAECLALMGQGGIVAGSGVAVVEHDRRRAPDQHYGCLVRTDIRRYGDTAVSFFRSES